MKLRIYGPARADLENAFEYIAQDSPRAAQQIVERILVSLERLPQSPRLGRPGRVAGTRELVITRTPYVAVYEILGDSIAVTRVLHGRQRWPPD